MSTLTVTELLARFTASRCGEAFREVVQRYSGFVMAVALRQTAGDAAAAEDLVQEVFTGLARESRRVRGETLGAWLHRRTVFVASHWRRGEMRRRKREAAAAEVSPGTSAMVVPEGFDEAFTRLREADQQLLFWHYMEDEDYRSIGARLGISDDAAQKRTARALEQLRASLLKSGAVPAGTTLTAVLVAAAGSEPVSAAQQIQWAATATEAAAQTKWAAAGFLLPAACLVAGVALPAAIPRTTDSPVPPPPVIVEAAGNPSPPPPERAPEPPGVQTDLTGLLSATEKAEHSPLWAARLDRTVSRFTAAHCRSTMEEIGYERDNSGQASRFLPPLRKKIVAQWAEADPVDAARKLRDGQEIEIAYRALGARDIAAAEREIANLTPPPNTDRGSHQGACWRAAIGGLGAKDLDAALAHWQGGAQRLALPYTDYMEQYLWQDFVQTNPAAAARKLAEIGGALEDQHRSSAMENLAKSDPRLAWRLLQEKPLGAETRSNVEANLFQSLQSKDPELAFRIGPELLGERAASHASLLVPSLVALGYEKAWAEISKAPGGVWREALERELGSKFAWDKPKEALAKFKAADSETSGMWWKALGSLASMDAEAALAVTIPPNAKPASLWGIAQTLNAKDPATAEQWLAALPDAFKKEVQEARDSLARQVASDPAAQAKAAAARGDDAQQMKTLSAALPQWYQRDPQAAAAFAHTLKGDARLAAFASIAAAAQVRSPSQLASAQQMLEEVAAQQTPLPQEVRSGIWSFTANWTQDDPEAASAWMNSLPRGPAFDQAASGLIRSLYQSDAAEALVWAAAIGDDTARTGAANILIQDWSMADNADCRAAIESLDAPEAVKAGFLKLIRPEQP